MKKEKFMFRNWSTKFILKKGAKISSTYVEQKAFRFSP